MIIAIPSAREILSEGCSFKSYITPNTVENLIVATAECSRQNHAFFGVVFDDTIEFDFSQIVKDNLTIVNECLELDADILVLAAEKIKMPIKYTQTLYWIETFSGRGALLIFAKAYDAIFRIPSEDLLTSIELILPSIFNKVLITCNSIPILTERLKCIDTYRRLKILDKVYAAYGMCR